MAALEALFWVGAICVVYPYVIYPFALAVLVQLRSGGTAARGDVAKASPKSLPTVSVVLAAYNEETTIDRRLRELVGLIDRLSVEGEVIVVSDGSTDLTAEITRVWAKNDVRVRLVELDGRRGKAVALTEGCALARHEIVVFADARQSWAPNSLVCLLENFADPARRGGQRRADRRECAGSHGRSRPLLAIREVDPAAREPGRFLGRRDGRDQRRPEDAVPADPRGHDPRRRLLAALRGVAGLPGDARRRVPGHTTASPNAYRTNFAARYVP